MERIVLVCAASGSECERLILAGRDIAQAEGLPLHVLHVLEAGAGGIGSPNERDTLNRLYALARGAGAEMTLLSARDAKAAIAGYARRNNALCVVAGGGPRGACQAEDLQSALGKEIRVLRA